MQKASSLLLQVKPPGAGSSGASSSETATVATSLQEALAAPEPSGSSAVQPTTEAGGPSAALRSAPALAVTAPPPTETGADTSLAEFLSLPPMVRDLSQSGAALKTQLQRQLAVLHEEERAWGQIMANGTQQQAAAKEVGGAINSGGSHVALGSQQEESHSGIEASVLLEASKGAEGVAAPVLLEASKGAEGVGEGAAWSVVPEQPAAAEASLLKATEDSANSSMGIQVGFKRCPRCLSSHGQGIVPCSHA